MGKTNSGEAQSEGTPKPAVAPAKDENDSRNTAPTPPQGREQGDTQAGNQADSSAYCESLMLRAATIDELLADDLAPRQEPYGDTDSAAGALATRRLTAWSRAAAGGDPALFERRLARDGLSIAKVRARLGTTHSKGSVPTWLAGLVADATWILAALEDRTDRPRPAASTDAAPGAQPRPALRL